MAIQPCNQLVFDWLAARQHAHDIDSGAQIYVVALQLIDATKVLLKVLRISNN